MANHANNPDLSRLLTTATNFYAGRSNQDDDSTPRFTMMEAECRACLTYVATGLPAATDADLHRQMRQAIAELLLVVSADFKDAGFRFAAADAKAASGLVAVI